MNDTLQIARRSLRTGTALPLLALLAAGISLPAHAQDASSRPEAQSEPAVAERQAAAPAPAVEDQEPVEDVVVTGSLFVDTTSATMSPITVVTAEALDKRGINTVQDALQQLTSNNGPALTNSFSANGGFAAGASAVSLRGLSTNSTLVLFDGQRAAYYPLADDGSRNFVDLNTIPDDIVERVEVLRDGASSTYGADASAGVVNIITRRTFQGVRARAEAGISQDGIAANQRLSLTLGTGDLADNGLNAYVSGFYYKADAVYNRDLPYPFNTSNESGICYEGECGPNRIINSRDPSTGMLRGFSGGSFDLYVRPYAADNTSIAGSRYELLNPAAGCRYGPGYRLTAEEIALRDSTGALINGIAPVNTQVCTADVVQSFGVVAPQIERFGGSTRVTAKLGDDAEAYFMANFQQSTVSYTGNPPLIRGDGATGILYQPFSTQGASPSLAPGSFALTLPVWVCATGVGDARGVNTGCNATNGRLNPNNPYAAAGQVARILGRPIQQPTFNQTRSRVYRAAFGVHGALADNWDYRLDATAMHNDLRRTQRGYVYIANLLTAIAQGTYNFVNPELNSQDVLDFVTPDNITDASSDLYAVQGSVSATLFDLPGGPLQFGFGGQLRYEAVDAPSANPDTNGPTQRFFTINAFGTKGNRTVYSAFAELKAPVLDILEVNASGRYDSYSSGQDAFSPKLSAKFTPIDGVAVRASYSRGFRIPSFGESNAYPTTGYVSVAPSTLPAAFLAQYSTPGNPNGPCAPDNARGCPSYITSYARGETSLASPNLDPEKSRSWTAGVVLNPLPNLSFTVDYYNIRKTDAITSAPTGPALEAYFAGRPIPAGYNVIADAHDPNFPTALARPAFVESPLINANTIDAEGIDIAARFSFDVSPRLKVTTTAELGYIINLSTTFENGETESYEGTLGNFALTAGSGTPEWRGSWQTALEFEPFTLNGTLNWFGGYDLSAEDETGPGTAGECGLSAGFTPCRVDDYLTFDLVGQVKVNDKFSFYMNVLNVFGSLPAVDAATYGAHLYNPVQAGNGIYGRSFRAGIRITY